MAVATTLCTGLSPDVFDALSDIVAETGWVCKECRTRSRQLFLLLQSGQAKLAEEVAALKSAVADIRLQLTNVTGTVTTDPSRTVQDAGGSNADIKIREAERRKRTGVVSGLAPETDIDDAQLFTKFCEEHLGTKPYVDPRRVRRVGKNTPQKLIVQLLSEHAAAELLLEARNLRNSGDEYIAKTVYFNRYLSPADAKIAFEKRVARRQAVLEANLEANLDSSLPSGQVTGISFP